MKGGGSNGGPRPSRWTAPREQLPITKRQQQIADAYERLGSGTVVARELGLCHSYVYEALKIVQEKREAQRGTK